MNPTRKARAFVFIYIVTLAMFFSVAHTAHAALTDGLVGHWTFDGKHMFPNARDISGSGNHGQLTGFAPTTTTKGKIGQALSFDGSNDYVRVEDSNSLDTASGLTVSFWMYDQNPSTLTHAIHKDDGASARSWIVRANSDTVGNFHVWNSGGTLRQYTPTDSWVKNRWTHITMTAEVVGSNIQIAVYRDGVLKGTDSFAGTAIRTGTAPVRMGTNDTLANFFRGTLDDVRIYSRAVSASEAKKLYRLGLGSKIAPTPKGNILAYYTFDTRNITSVARDSGASAYDGTLNGFGASPTVKGRVGQALSFNGSSNYVRLPTGLDVTASGSWSVWFKTTSGAASQEIIGKDTPTGGNQNHRVSMHSGLVSYHNATNGATDYTISSTRTYNDGKWHHMLATWGAGAAFYIDGALIGTSSSNAASDAATYICVGCNYNNGSIVWYFSGQIDDVRSYSRILSLSEARELYMSGLPANVNTTLPMPKIGQGGLVGHWTFDGKNMYPNVLDTSGQGNHGTLSGFTSTTTRPGKVGQALEFNGSSQYVGLGTGTFGISAGSTGVTIAAWVWVDSFKDYSAIFGKSQSSAPYGGWQMNTRSDNKFDFAVNVSGSWRTIQNDGTGTTARVAGRWYHLVGTYDGTTLRFYANGVADGTAAVSGTIQYANASANVRIGNNPGGAGGGGDYFDGKIDDVRIYNTPLTAREVNQLYKSATSYLR